MQNLSKLDSSVNQNSSTTEILTNDLPEAQQPWNTHRTDAMAVQAHLIDNNNDRVKRWHERLNDCSTTLWFTKNNDDFSLTKAHFCRVRFCPVCQWRRSLSWKARFFEAVPMLEAKYPTHRFLFLTLTVKNCEIKDLRTTIQAMNKAWVKLKKRKEFTSAITGWLRVVEVTRNANDNSAHPHFHVLLHVPAGYFKGHHYIKQTQWALLWQSCLGVDYEPIVNIQTIKAKKTNSEITDAVKEVLKYSVKPSDMISNKSWFLEMIQQLHKLRFIAAGGSLKNILKEEDEEMLDILDIEEEEEENKEAFAYDFVRIVKKYQRNAKKDKSVLIKSANNTK